MKLHILIALLTLAPLAAPAVAADAGFDAEMAGIFPVHNLVAGQQDVLVWGDANWHGAHEGPVDVLLTLDGAPLARYEHAYLDELNSVAVSADIPEAIEGNVTLAFILDPDNEVAETNEANNVASVTVYIHAAPFFDIAPLGLALPAHVFAGVPFRAEADVLVTGDPVVGGNFSGDGTGYFGQLLIDGEPDCCMWYMMLWPGVTQQGWWSLELDAGWHTYEVRVDVEDTAFETAETNNVARGSFYVHASPADAVIALKVQQPTLETDLGAIAPHPTDRTARVEVCNEGDVTIPAGSVTLEMLTPGLSVLAPERTTMLAETFSWLAPGACLTWEVEYPLRAVGDHEIVATVQAEAEIDITNNVARAEDFFLVGGAGGVAL